MKSPYINHVTLNTGHTRRSPRDEVRDDILGILHPWIEDMLIGKIPLPLPVPSLYHYCATATVEAGSLLCTIWAPRGPHTPGQPHPGESIPLVTLGVAQRSRHSTDLWAMMVAQFGAKPGLKKPNEPWCGVVVHSNLMDHIRTSDWLGDMERCIAWAWITRRPALVSVDG